MPISPENAARYPKDWARISLLVKQEAEWRCEGSPTYPECEAQHGCPHPVTGARVVLTVGHLDHHPEHCDRANLRAWCQRCHNTYDVTHRRKNAAHTRRAAKGNGELFTGGMADHG